MAKMLASIKFIILLDIDLVVVVEVVSVCLRYRARPRSLYQPL